MRISKKAYKAKVFFKNCKIKVPKRWRTCHECGDRLKGEPMYKQRKAKPCGYSEFYMTYWYCIECFNRLFIEGENYEN